MKQRPGVAETVSGTTSGSGAADGSTLVDSSLYSSAIPQLVRARSVIAITSGARDGDRRYATGPASSAGAVTVSPVFGAQIADSVTYEIWDADGPHPDVLDRMIDKALDEDCWYWHPRPLSVLRGSCVREGMTVSTNVLDVDGATAIWSPSAGTVSIQTMGFPNETFRRVFRFVPSAGSDVLESEAVDADPEYRQNWRIHLIARVFAANQAGGTLTPVLRDLTADADITVTWTPEATATRRGWALFKGTFDLPSDCNQFAVRISAASSAESAEIALCQVWNAQQRRYQCHPQVQTKGHVGNVFYWHGERFDERTAVPWMGSTERREAMGAGVSVFLGEPGNEAPWYYEKTPYPGLTTATPAATDDDATTWAPAAWVKAAVLWETYEWLAERDALNAPGRWDERRQKALAMLLAQQAQYGIERQIVTDNRRPVGRAVRRI
jgi:hypothetical protein